MKYVAPVQVLGHEFQPAIELSHEQWEVGNELAWDQYHLAMHRGAIEDTAQKARQDTWDRYTERINNARRKG